METVEPIFWHTCEDGHSWKEQPDGGVAPSWALGATSLAYDQPANRCPEPERFELVTGHLRRHDGIQCPACELIGLAQDMYVGRSSEPWLIYEEIKRTGHTHSPPLPACGKPPVETLEWTQVGKKLNWLEIEPSAFDGPQGVLC